MHTSTDPILDGLIAQFSAAEACWYSSLRPDGRVHLAPIWHIWLRSAIYVVTQPSAVRNRNLDSNASVSLALPDAKNVLIIEGFAERKNDMIAELRPFFQEKYRWDIATDSHYKVVIAVQPSKLLAWGNHGEGRWRFEPQSQQWSKIV